MAVQGSVQVTVSNGVATTVPLPAQGLNIVGVASQGAFCIVIPIDASRNAVIPFSSYLGVVEPMVRVNIPIIGTSFQVTAYTVSSGATLTFYYGTPSKVTLDFTKLAGVLVQNTFSAAGSATVTMQLPSNGKLIGVIVLTSGSSGNYAYAQIQTAAGFSLTVVGAYPYIGATDSIIPLDNLPVAQQTSVTLTSSMAQTVYAIFYYSL